MTMSVEELTDLVEYLGALGGTASARK
jgi:hypothetical protein